MKQSQILMQQSLQHPKSAANSSLGGAGNNDAGNEDHQAHVISQGTILGSQEVSERATIFNVDSKQAGIAIKVQHGSGANQAKQSSQVRSGNISEPSKKNSAASSARKNKVEGRLRASASSQFNVLADKIIGSVDEEQQIMGQAMDQAKGFNLVSSKSSKVLPISNKHQIIVGASKNIKYVNDHAKALKEAERFRVKNSVQNKMLRESARDEHLAARVRKINEKQTARIKQIETQEARNQQNQIEKFVQRSQSFAELNPSKSQKQIQPSQLLQSDSKFAGKTLEPMGTENKVGLSSMDDTIIKDMSKAKTTRDMATDYEQDGPQATKTPEVDHVEKKQQQKAAGSVLFNSNRKEYFNHQVHPTNSHNNSQLHKINESRSHARNDSSGFLASSGQPNQRSQIEHGKSVLSGITKSGLGQNSTFSTWGASKIIGVGTKERADVSFLQEKQALMYSQNASKKMAIDPAQAKLVSQSQITSGNEGRDDYLQIALGLRQIGKSIMDMPKSIDDLRLLSREYMKNLGVNDDLQDEQVYLTYIEEHLKYQDRQTTAMQQNKATHAALSPIRNLADFYQRKLDKLSLHNQGGGGNGQTSTTARTSPNKMKKAQVTSNNKTFVDIEQMTVFDLEKLENSPPSIRPGRKNMKMMNNRAMQQFGGEAFSIKLEPEVVHPRLNAHSNKPNIVIDSSTEPAKGKHMSAGPVTESVTPRIKRKQQARTSFQPKDSTIVTTDRELKESQRRKLLSSLNDLADQLTKPSIAPEDKDKPQWLQATLKEEAARMGLSQANLGKPSSRQDAVLLAKWFKGIIDMIEIEFQKSTDRFSKGTKKIFPTQKVADNEILQTDSYLLIQIAHNIAIKEITRQVSVQCIERGILLKTIFDSYVRMIDLVFEDSVFQRKVLAQKFADVCEKQVYFQNEQIQKKDEIVAQKEEHVQDLMREMEKMRSKELALQSTNKKLTTISMRTNDKNMELQKANTAYSRQVKYLEERLERAVAALGPEQAQQFQNETKKAMRKINTQATIDHEQMLANKKLMKESDVNTELELVAGQLIKMQDNKTDMRGHLEFLEECNGGPLQISFEMQAEQEVDEKSCSGFDMYEVGAICDAETFVDVQWRKETRPRRIKAQSENGAAYASRCEELEGPHMADKRINMLDGASFDTSSHHTIDYQLETHSAKSFTFGLNISRYQHLKRQRPAKRSLSAGNFNWNLLVTRVDKRLEKEQKKFDAFVSGQPMVKLIGIIGQQLFNRIRDEYPELHDLLMQHIKLKKNITYGFAREVLAGYGIILDEERRAARMAHSNEHRNNLDANFYENDDQMAGEDNADRDSTILNKQSLTEMLTRDQKMKDGKAGSMGGNSKDKKKEKMTQFVEWNFQRRDKRKKEKMRRDHPSFNIVTKLLDKFKLGKDIKELMPVKSIARFIYNIYMAKAADLASDKQTQQMPQLQRAEPIRKSKDRSISPGDVNQRAAGGGSGTPRGTTRSIIVKDQDNDKPENLGGYTSMLEFAYEYFQNRYGLKNVADKKFTQFVGSILKYKDKLPRIRLAGRFMQLYDELSDCDLKLYIDMVHNMFKAVLNFSILEQDEVVLIPVGRAQDYFRISFASRLTSSSMSHCVRIIKQKSIAVTAQNKEKHMHLQNCNEAVQLDEFAEFVIHTSNQLQAEKMQNIYEIFMASDLDNNSIITFNEFKTLYRLLCSQHSGDMNLQMNEIRTLFNEYAEHHRNPEASDDGMKVRGIVFERFEDLCLEKDVFTIRQQNSFINAATRTFLSVTDAQDSFGVEFEKLNASIDTIYDRLMDAINSTMDSEIVGDGDKLRYKDMVEQMTKAVMQAKNKKIAFLTFKIVEETIKRVCLKIEIDRLMPVQPETLRTVKRVLYESKVFQGVDHGSLVVKQQQYYQLNSSGQHGSERAAIEQQLNRTSSQVYGKPSSTSRSFDLNVPQMDPTVIKRSQSNLGHNLSGFQGEKYRGNDSMENKQSLQSQMDKSPSQAGKSGRNMSNNDRRSLSKVTK